MTLLGSDSIAVFVATMPGGDHCHFPFARFQEMSSVRSGVATASPKKKYVRAVGPRLRKLLYFIFVLVALLFANSGYLALVTFLEWVRNDT